jgi:hypothetical protein
MKNKKEILKQRKLKSKGMNIKMISLKLLEIKKINFKNNYKNLDLNSNNSADKFVYLNKN